MEGHHLREILHDLVADGCQPLVFPLSILINLIIFQFCEFLIALEFVCEARPLICISSSILRFRVWDWPLITSILSLLVLSLLWLLLFDFFFTRFIIFVILVFLIMQRSCVLSLPLCAYITLLAGFGLWSSLFGFLITAFIDRAASFEVLTSIRASLCRILLNISTKIFKLLFCSLLIIRFFIFDCLLHCGCGKGFLVARIDLLNVLRGTSIVLALRKVCCSCSCIRLGPLRFSCWLNDSIIM